MLQRLASALGLIGCTGVHSIQQGTGRAKSTLIETGASIVQELRELQQPNLSRGQVVKQAKRVELAFKAALAAAEKDAAVALAAAERDVAAAGKDAAEAAAERDAAVASKELAELQLKVRKGKMVRRAAGGLHLRRINKRNLRCIPLAPPAHSAIFQCCRR